jgi:hypothetical protein
MGRLLTCYAPVRHWAPKDPVRLACVKRAASVRPEPGSNSPLENPNSSRNKRVIRLLGIRVVQFPYTGTRRTRCLPRPVRGERATGRPVQALPNTLIVKRFAAIDRFHKGNPASFTRPVASLPLPSARRLGRAFQSTTVRPARQPRGRRDFLDFRAEVLSYNSLKLLHLGQIVKRLSRSFRSPAPPLAPFGRQP